MAEMDVDGGPSDCHGGQRAAPLPVPLRAVTSLEHPCIIKNVDKAIESLGGAWKLSQGLKSEVPEDNEKINYTSPIAVSLRPQDPLAQRLPAFPVDTSNILLKITVPKRTGRKRKRGSNGPFSYEPTLHGRNEQPSDFHVPTEVVLRSLQDNASKWTVTPVGFIDETNRCREMPDIQSACADDPLMQNVQAKLFSLRCCDINKYEFNTTPGSDKSKVVAPSPQFLQMPIFYDYKFEQNPAVRYAEGGGVELNVQKHLALFGYHIIPATAEFVPMGPKPGNPPEDKQSDEVRRMIRKIRYEMKHRPVITRRVLFNRCGWHKRDLVRNAAVYCGYFFDSGPWREALVAWGVDPRSDPEYRKLQTISFQSFDRTGETRTGMYWSQHVSILAQMPPENLMTEHIFDGNHVSHSGTIFQFCDILDPQIRQILDTPDIRETCAPGFQGWYHAGTWARATVILKHKLNTIILGRKPDPSIYETVAHWPEMWDDAEIWATYHDEYYRNVQRQDKTKATTFRVMYNVRLAARNPRYAFERIEEQHKRGAGGGDDENEGGMDDHTITVPEDMREFPDQAADLVFDAQPEDMLGSDFYGSGDDETEEDGDDEDDDEAGSDDESEDMEVSEEDSSSDSSMDYDQAVKKPRPFGGLYRV